jgi:hypothetical protein
MFSVMLSKATTILAMQQRALPLLLRKYAAFLFPVCVLLLGVSVLSTYLESSLTTMVVGYAAITSTITGKKQQSPSAMQRQR